MKFLLKIINCLNPTSIFKNIKRYMENRAKIESDLIDKEKQRQHEKKIYKILNYIMNHLKMKKTEYCKKN